MRFTLDIDCNNAAFTGEDEGSAGPLIDEVARLLGEAKRRVQAGITSTELRDINGNTVGRYAIEDDVTRDTLFSELQQLCQKVGRTTAMTDEMLEVAIDSLILEA